MHYKVVAQAVDDPIFTFDTLKISSMVGRNCRVSLNDPRESATGEPLVVLHMGINRAVNIIPKKYNLAMMDVFDVRLGNFAVITVSSKTRDSMAVCSLVSRVKRH